MSNLPQVFNYKNHQVRIFLIDGEPWWVAKDVCDVLELGDTHKVMERLDEDERNTIPVTDSLLVVENQKQKTSSDGLHMRLYLRYARLEHMH